jgi:hypothetical protein
MPPDLDHQDPDLAGDGGWTYSARAYIDFQDRGDYNRTLLLDPVMLRLCGDVGGQRALEWPAMRIRGPEYTCGCIPQRREA